MKYSLIYCLIFSVILFDSCISSTKNVFILPSGYQGVVVVFHDIDKGERIQEMNNSFVYTIRDNGVLLVKSSIRESCSQIEY